MLLRRLAVFVGHFSIDAALEVVTTGAIDKEHVFSAIDGLAAKSMVATRPAGAMMRYRLLDTTRAYALQIAPGDPDSSRPRRAPCDLSPALAGGGRHESGQR